jgi:hypothetical protein
MYLGPSWQSRSEAEKSAERARLRKLADAQEQLMRERGARKEEAEFSRLKIKYKATKHQDSLSASLLYSILKKIELGEPLSVLNINWLSRQGLSETIFIYENSRHFATLKYKYGVSDYRDKSPSSPLYAILQKFEKKERLEPRDIAWLTQKNLFYWDRKIATEYHTLEALFYEQGFERTNNKWHLPSASSHWRKAGKPQRALQLTENLDWDRVKDKKLKSVLLTTRGGAFRDIQKLDKAEECARQAIEYQPGSHHPYTLMGAICYERGEYSKGDHWFEEAIKRGASPKDQDAEIKRVIGAAKDENKRREVVEYLLKKDPMRYAWAKSYHKKNPKNKGR